MWDGYVVGVGVRVLQHGSKMLSFYFLVIKGKGIYGTSPYL
jgi:hypothetical protein